MTASVLSKTLLMGAVASAVVCFTASSQAADMVGKEKCYGIAKAGKNDCASGANSCAGHAAKDNQGDAFLIVPKGLCEKLVGGSTEPGK